MITKIRFGPGFVDLYNYYVTEIDCPNSFGGIGDITVKPGENEVWIWTGQTWLIVQGTIKFSVGVVDSIETRSNLDETEEPWVPLWKQPVKFTYEAWFEAARLLKEVTWRP